MQADILNAYVSTVFDLTESVKLEDSRPHAFGGFADIWLGWYTNPAGTEEKVAIKRLRVRNQEGEASRLVRYLGKELRVWKRLDHPNVLPLYGLTYDMGALPAMVCPWQEHGNLTQYLGRVGEKISIDERYSILLQVAQGLQYLHNSSVVHGDLTGSNVLIGREKQVYLSDFGLSTIKRDTSSSSYGSSSALSVPGGAGAVRWAAPELFLPDDQGQLSSVSFAADVYSLASLWHQILSDQIPYHHLRNEVAVVLQLSKGARPPRPENSDVSDDVWHFIQKCWATVPHQRPSMHEVIAEIEKYSIVSGSGNTNTIKFLTDVFDHIEVPTPVTTSITTSKYSENIPDFLKPMSKSRLIRTRLYKLGQSIWPATRLSGRSGHVPRPCKTPLESIGVPDYQGYIQRKRGRSANTVDQWHTCYLMLKDIHLYRLDKLQGQKLKGYVNLAGYQVVPGSTELPAEFRLFKPDSEDPVQHFRSADTESIQCWIWAIQKALSLKTDSSISTVSISAIGTSVSASSSDEED